MVKVAGGSFKSGKDQRPVKVNEFQIDKFEVTNAQYKKFQKDFAVPDGRGNHPVVEISYFDAEGFCKSVGKRLPTQAEWEKAARGEDGRTYPWGNEFNSANANTLESDINDTSPVGSYKSGKSPYGAMDMCGNVWEWVDSWSGNEKKYRILMGGSYFDDANKSATYSTLTSIPDDTHPYIGFRCAK